MKLTALITVLALLLTGCSLSAADDNKDTSSQPEVLAAEEAEYPVSEFGADLDSRPGIIASLSPAITEKLIDLELGGRLEGISDYCAEPGDGVSRVRLGDSRSPDVEAIKNLSPHLLLTAAELSNADHTALLQSGIEIAVIPRPGSIDELYEQYSGLARLLDGNLTGGALGERFCEDLDEKISGIAKQALPEPKNALYLRATDFTVATGDTLENELLELIGLNNIASAQSDWVYPEEEAKSETGRAAFSSLDFIFMDERYVTIKMLEQNEFYRGLNAVLKDYYLYIDMAAFERAGLKMFDELASMASYVAGDGGE